MSFSVEQLPQEPIVISTLHEDMAFLSEMTDLQYAVREILEGSDEPLFLIVDLQLSMGFEEMLVGANAVGRGEQPVWHHPKIRQVVLVAPSDFLQTVAKGMSHEMFGNLNIQVVKTRDEALEYIRSRS